MTVEVAPVHPGAPSRDAPVGASRDGTRRTRSATARVRLKLLLPLAVIALGIAVSALLLALRPQLETRPAEVLPPLVRVLPLRSTSVQLAVSSQGTVIPRTESDLVAEVSGRVTWASPALAAGGFFEAGDVLLRLDARDLEIAVERTAARLQQRESEADLAARLLERRRALSLRGAASVSDLDERESAARVTAALRRDARAALGKAQLDLERAELRAPFAGRVRSTQVDVGQFVNRGTPLARLYAVDYAEVRLPIPDEDLAHLDLSLGDREEEVNGRRPAVTLSARLAGRDVSWPGHIVRTEGVIDSQTRMVHVVVRVNDPYGRNGGPSSPPLPAGLFVEAEIEGHRLDGVFRVPRSALNGQSRLLLVDGEDRIRLRTVEVVHRDSDSAIIAAGLADGEQLCVSRLEAVSDGMRVRTAPPANAGM